jgi:hypothetical protein
MGRAIDQQTTLITRGFNTAAGAIKGLVAGLGVGFGAAEEQLARLEAMIARASDRPDEVVPLLAALLGIPTGERYPARARPHVYSRRAARSSTTEPPSPKLGSGCLTIGPGPLLSRKT